MFTKSCKSRWEVTYLVLQQNPMYKHVQNRHIRQLEQHHASG